MLRIAQVLSVGVVASFIAYAGWRAESYLAATPPPIVVPPLKAWAPGDGPTQASPPLAPGEEIWPADVTNRGEFIQPIDQPFLTRDERKRLMDAPGVKFLRRGPKGSPFYNFGQTVGPYDDRQFRVSVLPDAQATDEQRALVDEARKKLEAERPENPGRSTSFPLWVTVPGEGRPSVPLVHSGWSLSIRDFRPIPGGWQAGVEVRPLVRTEFYEPAWVADFHHEAYSCVDGRLMLDFEGPNLFRSSPPEAGIRALVRE